jgi:pimeloyl-ACP methyl ester carboxylesterase
MIRRIARWFLWFLVATAVVVACSWWLARPAKTGAFFAAPASVPAQAGVLVRSEPFATDVPSNARAWRILYTTITANGAPALSSAIVVRSTVPGRARRPMIAWAHGTTGVVPGCGPSQLKKPFANFPALDALLAEGWVLVASDYAGQGTTAPNPYLIGPGEAYSVLDSVRAAGQLLPDDLDGQVVVWGHSQGGHAALWTGSLARNYASDLNIVAVATLAPATDLRSLLNAAQHTMVGRIMSSFVLRAYGDHYRDSGFDAYTRGWRGALARDMAGRCLAEPGAVFSVAEAALLGTTVFSSSPLSGALEGHLAENTPGNLGATPILVLQGERDELVLPHVQSEFIRQRCASGRAIELHRFKSDDHVSIVSSTSDAPRLLLDWTRDRLASRPWQETCTDTAH